jgi:hypothetical protein
VRHVGKRALLGAGCSGDVAYCLSTYLNRDSLKVRINGRAQVRPPSAGRLFF